MAKKARCLDDGQKGFGKIFDSLCGRHNPWDIWASFVTMSAISISNAVDQDHAEKREQEYLRIAKKYSEDELELFTKLFAIVVEQLEANPAQDYLGELYLRLGMNDHWKGQFFTPYHVCEFMAAVTGMESLDGDIGENGWASVNDPACGAGALLVAYANECRKRDINYQTSVLFVAQDIDPIVAYMCYLQLSLLGCPGYVVIGDSLAHPLTCIDGRGLIPDPRQDIWYTPFYFRQEWHIRRQAFALQTLLQEVCRVDPATIQQSPNVDPATIRQSPNVEWNQTPLGETETGQLTLL